MGKLEGKKAVWKMKKGSLEEFVSDSIKYREQGMKNSSKTANLKEMTKLSKPRRRS
jgi:hypothetical protein